MIVTFNIPNDKIARISASLDILGYTFNPELGTTDANQRLDFFKRNTIKYWQSDVFNYERSIAIENELKGQNDSAALQAKRFTEFNDISAT